MLFNSIEFAVFLPLVFIIYWSLSRTSIKLQNIFLLIASYIFYGWWDWRFLFLIIISSSVDFTVGITLDRTKSLYYRKILLITSIFFNIGILGFFKYFNFFIDNFYNAFTFLGGQISDPILVNIILPVGISFYTFQTLSYSIGVYRKEITATNDIVSFFTFVAFFPQLVAGPIERATNLLPQFYNKRIFDQVKASDGLRQILWGLFKKIVIADNCAIYVNDIFLNYNSYSGSTLLLGAVLFAFQIYGDFSGYSDIAIGTSRLFGFSLMKNFAFPYFSRDVAEFWRRWHISLTTWFRDYIYIPLGGSKAGKWISIRNTFVLFLISGFWHGANWTFIAWGAINALFFLPLMLGGKNRVNLDIVAAGRLLPNPKEILQMGSTFCAISLTWVFFRAESITHANAYLSKIFSPSLLTLPEVLPKTSILLVCLMLVIEWAQREKNHALEFEPTGQTKSLRWGAYITIIFLVLNFGGEQQDFIYFQF